MRFLMRLLAFPLMALLIAMPAGADEIDRQDPTATAVAFLTAYKARDVVAMAPLSNETNRKMFTALANEGKQHKAYDNVFGGWRWTAAQAWTGDVGTVRYNKGGHALVPFGEKDGEVFVVVLTSDDDGIWGLEDINSPDKADFEALPTEAPE